MAVHCRTGSLERQESAPVFPVAVHCRTGSLEIVNHAAQFIGLVHCRTGSLEKREQDSQQRAQRSLPHRQLRNVCPALGDGGMAFTAAQAA